MSSVIEIKMHVGWVVKWFRFQMDSQPLFANILFLLIGLCIRGRCSRSFVTTKWLIKFPTLSTKDNTYDGLVANKKRISGTKKKTRSTFSLDTQK